MFPWSSKPIRIALLALAAAIVSPAQMPSRNQKVDTQRVGARLACQCGCSDTVATCSMLGCWSHSAKEKIAGMQQAGLSDQAIIDDFIKEYGAAIYRGAPNAFGWLIPYLALALGGAAVIAFVKRARRPRLATAGAAAGDPKLERYSDQIERELEDLDR
jgi:cytochrome c-type biogenesis protein CcmH/NrfF